MVKRCEIDNCGSRSLRHGEDGFLYCSEGHQQTQGGLVTADGEGFPSLGRRTILKTTEEGSLLTGKEGVQHYLLCFQLILRHQIYALVQELDFPPEIEQIVQDLWLLRLSGLQERIRAATDGQNDASSRRRFSSQDASTDRSSSAGSLHAEPASLPSVLDGAAMIYLAIRLLRLPITTQNLFQMIESGKLLYYRSSQRLSSGMKSRLHGLYHIRLDPNNQLTIQRLLSGLRDNFCLFQDSFGLAIPPLNHTLCLFKLVKELGLPIEVYNGSLCLVRLLGLNFHPPNRSSNSIGMPERQVAAVIIFMTKLFYPFDSYDRPPARATEPAAIVVDWAAWKHMTDQRENAASKEDADPFATALNTRESDVPDMTEAQMDRYMSWFQSTYISEEERPNHGRADGEAAFCQTIDAFFPLKAAPQPMKQARTTTKMMPMTTAEVEEADGSNVQDGVAAKVGQADGTNMLHGVDTATYIRMVQGSSIKAAPRVLAESAPGEERRDGGPLRPGSRYQRCRRDQDLVGPMRDFYTAVAKVTGLKLAWVIESTYALERRLLLLGRRSKKMRK